MSLYGLRIRDAAGNIILDTSHHVLRVIGSASVANGASDSRSDARMATGGWYAFQPDTYNGYNAGGVMRPQFTIVNGVLSWSYPARNAALDVYCNGTVFYGAY